MSPPLRVVIADDEPLALERLALAFRDIEGAEVVGAAANGLEALDLIAALRPDLAVLDIQMPGRTGLGVAGALPPNDRPEIIFLTAFDSHAVDAFDVEAADYVLKPLRLERLRQAEPAADEGRRDGVRFAEEQPDQAGDAAPGLRHLPDQGTGDVVEGGARAGRERHHGQGGSRSGRCLDSAMPAGLNLRHAHARDLRRPACLPRRAPA